MNCRRAARLLCLGVLEDRGSRRRPPVAAHLARCADCRTFREDLEVTLEAARSLEPLQLGLGEELRRSVWREIQKDRLRAANPRTTAWGRLVLSAGATAGLACLLVLIHSRAGRSVEESKTSLDNFVDPGATSRPIAMEVSATEHRAGPAAGSQGSRITSRRSNSGDGNISRIEFWTPDPNIRIIWLVDHGAAENPPPKPSDLKQEVS